MTIPAKVFEAIQKRFFPDALLIEEIASELKYDKLNNIYYFYYAGMYVGIEEDGWMHT